MAVSSSSSSSSTAALKEGRTAEIIHSVMLCQLEGDSADTPMVVALGDESYAGMCRAIISQTTPAMPCGYELIGGFRATRRDQRRLVFGRDNDGICYCVLTSRYYSHAKACNFLVDVATGLSQASTASRSAIATASTSEGRDIVASLCKEYSSSDSIKTKPSPTSPPKMIENQSKKHMHQHQQPILMLQSIRPTRGAVPPPMKPIPDDSFLIDCSSTSRTSRTLSSSSRSTATTRSLSTTGSRSTVSSSSSSSSYSFSRWAAEPFSGPRRHKSQNSIAMPLVQQQQQAEQSTSRRTVQFDESSLAASPKQASQPQHNKSSRRSVSTDEDSACPPPPTSPLSRRSVSLDDATIGSSASSTSSRRRRKKSEDASKAHRASSFAASSRVGGDALLDDSAHQSRQPRKSVQFDEASIVASPKRASQTGRRSRSSRRSVSMDEASVTSSPKPKSMSRRCVSMDDANGSISSSRHSRRSIRDDASTIGGGSTCASSYVGGDGLFFWEGLQPHFAEPELFPYHISGGDSVHNFADNSTVASGQSMNDPLGANSWHTRASTTSRGY